MPSTENNSERGNFRAWLDQQFQERRQKNPRFSLRAFGKLLRMDASTVSQILSGKRHPSPKLQARVMETLKVPPEVQREVIGDSSPLRE